MTQSSIITSQHTKPIFLSNFNTGAPPSIRQGLGYPEFCLPHSVCGPIAHITNEPTPPDPERNLK